MKSLLVYMKDYKKESVLAPLFKMLEATFELFVPLVMASIIDKGIASKDSGYIIKMCGILALLAIVGLVCAISAQYFAAKAAVGFATKLRHALFSHIQQLSFSEMDTIGTSTLITRMTSDINQVQSGVNLVLRLFLRSPFIVFGAMIMAFTIDVRAALIFVVTIPALSVVVFGIMLITMPMYKKVQTGLDKVLGITRENLTGARVIRAFDKEDDEIEHFQESNEMLTSFQKSVGRISGLMNPITYVIINVAIVALIWTGALRVEAGIITQGAVVALVNYMSQILVELIKLANLIITVTKAMACAKRVESVFTIESSMPKTVNVENTTEAQAGDTEDIVTFENVSLTYAGAGDESLTDINFTVKKGQTIGIIGGTGSGKSSVVNLIPRFYDATKGRVLIDSKDAKSYPVNELRAKVGVVMQKAVLFKGTIRENLAWGLSDELEGSDLNSNEIEARMYEALDIAQAREFVDKKDGKLDAEIAQGGKNLSGGQKQRLTIARALMLQPDILILDDSASALDFATDAKLRKAIREMKKSPTVFIVSQRAASLMYADQIIVMEDGKVAGIGTHNELMSNCDVYQEIYNSQFKKTVQE